MKLLFLGGASEIGKVGLVLEEGNSKLLFDYGIVPSEPPAYPIQAPQVDLALLSHSHIDHSGMIPWLCGKYQTQVLGTSPTINVSEILISDNTKICGIEGYPLMYDQRDMEITRECFKAVKYNEIIKNNDLEIQIHSAGHIPGSSMFEIKSEKTTLFTGDLNTIDTRLLLGTHPVKCDNLIIEATYANRDHEPRAEIEKAFFDKIQEVVDRGGTAVVPAFAVGRTQEILLLLKDSYYDIWLDGMGKKVTNVYIKDSEYLRDGSKLKKVLNQVKKVRSSSGRKRAVKGEIIVTTSGMLDGGPVLEYLKRLKSNPKNAILLTGYQVEGTNGRLLKEKGIMHFHGVPEKIQCEVADFDFSAHAGHKELIQFIRGCNPENVVLFHSPNREVIAEELGDEFNFITPGDGQTVEI